ncbi:MAG: sterol desaturase family protein [Steroidobacteraceae bacterium]
MAVLFIAERLRRWHAVPPGRARIGIANVALGAVGAVGVRLLLPWAGVAAALTAESRGIGLAQVFDWPLWLAAVVGFLGLDLAIYAQHRASHAVPLLWRLHRVHHTETHLDFTSALRFHPVEIVLSACWRWLVIVALGAPAVAVLVFETVLNGTALFNHSNLQLPARFDCALRLGVVTPAMHRVHHSILHAEQQHNFGFNLPWWDWLFGSYLKQSAQGCDVPRIGVGGHPLSSRRPFLAMLRDPII